MATSLSWYPRPPIDTGMGMHDSHLTGQNPPDIRQHAKNLRKAGFSWSKLLVGGTNKVERARVEVQEGLMPVVRFYVERPHPNWLPNSGEVAAYVAVGAKYIESGNEQNLLDEVQGQINPEAVAAQWIRASDIIKSVGGIPVVYACTPGGHMNHRVYTNRFLAEVKRLGRLDSFDRAVLGIHPRPLNNPPDQPRDTGNPPNTTTWNEWTWYREAYFNYLGWHIPLIATEHGYSGRGQENGEHPPMNDATWAEWNKELFYRFNPSHPKAVAPEFLAACYWLEVNEGVWIWDAPFARDGREWIDDKPRQDDRAWGKALWTIQPTWNRNGAQPPVDPPTEPPTTPPTVPPREVINLPSWVTINEAANVPVGSEYWFLKKFQYQDDTQSGGNHVIFVQEPHSATQRFTVTNGQTTWNDNRLDKPANEPAGNFPMFGGNIYKLWMNGLPSDSVEGMKMPSNHHVNYITTWEKRVKEGEVPEPVPNPNELEAAIWLAVEAKQIPINRTFALAKRLIAESVAAGDNQKGFDIVSPEVTVDHAGTRYVAQLAQRPSDDAKIAVYAPKDRWELMKVLRKGGTQAGKEVDVPYVRQRGEGANGSANDCGAAAVKGLILINRNAVPAVDTLAKEAATIEGQPYPNYTGLQLSTLITLGKRYGVELERETPKSWTAALTTVVSSLKEGEPIIALVHYDALPVANRLIKTNGKVKGHYITLYRSDNKGVTYNDPYHDGEGGKGLFMTWEQLRAAWEANPADDNPKYAMLVMLNAQQAKQAA